MFYMNFSDEMWDWKCEEYGLQLGKSKIFDFLSYFLSIIDQTVGHTIDIYLVKMDLKQMYLMDSGTM